MNLAEAAVQRIGILGGAFDPPHLAHLALAKAAIAQLQLDQLRIIPTGQAWHNLGQFTVVGGTLTVILSDRAAAIDPSEGFGAFVVAGRVRVAPVGVAGAAALIISNRDVGFGYAEQTQTVLTMPLPGDAVAKLDANSLPQALLDALAAHPDRISPWYLRENAFTDNTSLLAGLPGDPLPVANLPLVNLLRLHADPLSAYLYTNLPAAQRAVIDNPAADKDALKAALVAGLNTLLAGPSIYTADRFAGVTLLQSTNDLRLSAPTGERLLQPDRPQRGHRLPGQHLGCWLAVADRRAGEG